jgi:hypothetical protein
MYKQVQSDNPSFITVCDVGNDMVGTGAELQTNIKRTISVCGIVLFVTQPYTGIDRNSVQT